jgi:hypothetical protein
MTLAVPSVSDTTFRLYGSGLIVVGILLIVLGWRVKGSTIAARVICIVIGAVGLVDGIYVTAFTQRHQLWELYPFAFILALLAVGYLLKERQLNREYDEEARAVIAAEKAAKRAAAQASAAEQVQPEEPQPQRES